MEKIDQSNISNNNSRVPASNQGLGVPQDSFFSTPEQTVVITFHNDFESSLPLRFFSKMTGRGDTRPTRSCRVASTELLPGSCLAFVRGVPASFANAANEAAANWEFWDALSIIGRAYIKTHKSYRGFGSASSYYSQEIHDSLVSTALEDEGGER